VGLASAVILRSESRGTHDNILLSPIRDSSTWRARFPYLYAPGTRWPSYTPRHWVPVSSPPATRRATVEVLEPASTRDLILHHHALPLVTPRYGLRRNHRFSLLCLNSCRQNMFVCEAVTQWRLPYICLFRGRCLQSHYLATGLRAKYGIRTTHVYWDWRWRRLSLWSSGLRQNIAL
jgi:hypothetical protein